MGEAQQSQLAGGPVREKVRFLLFQAKTALHDYHGDVIDPLIVRLPPSYMPQLCLPVVIECTTWTWTVDVDDSTNNWGLDVGLAVARCSATAFCSRKCWGAWVSINTSSVPIFTPGTLHQEKPLVCYIARHPRTVLSMRFFQYRGGLHRTWAGGKKRRQNKHILGAEKIGSSFLAHNKSVSPVQWKYACM